MANKIYNKKVNLYEKLDKTTDSFASDDKLDKRFNYVQHQAKSTAAITIDSSTTVRNPFTKQDYNYYRPNEAVPTRFIDVVHACRSAYYKVGVVRNVIDMMTDFATEDFKIVHPDKKVEAFVKVWMKKVNLLNAIDEFVRHFLIDCNVAVKRVTAQLTQPVEKQWMENKAISEADEKLYTENGPNKREIPWRYIFVNVTALEWIKTDTLDDNKQLGFRVSKSIINSLKSGGNYDFRNKFFSNIPKELAKDLASGKSNLVPLDMKKMYVAHNKKDSWDDWAWPFLYSVLADIKFKDKLKQADLSALDGIINIVRIWKLGDHVNGILPSADVTQRLIDILENNTGGGAIDLVWDSMISCEEHYPPVKDILGSEKYEQVNKDILIGLGVPEVLIGGQGANFSNSWIQLRTLVEKLEYVRDHVAAWVNGEIAVLCKAMDIEIMPKVRFNQMNLEDENITRKLIVGLMDRGVISVEAVLDAYGEDYLLEVQRIQEEAKINKKFGLDVKGPFDQPEAAGPTGRPPAGKNIKMNTRTPKPRRGSGQLFVQGLDTIDLIEEKIVPIYMDSFGTTNARKLTTEQKEELNIARTYALSCIKPSDSVSADNIVSIVENGISNKDVLETISSEIAEFAKNHKGSPTLQQRKRIEAIAWAIVYGEENG